MLKQITLLIHADVEKHQLSRLHPCVAHVHAQHRTSINKKTDGSAWCYALQQVDLLAPPITQANCSLKCSNS